MPTRTLTLDFCLQNWETIRFCCFAPAVCAPCQSSPRRLSQEQRCRGREPVRMPLMTLPPMHVCRWAIRGDGVLGDTARSPGTWVALWLSATPLRQVVSLENYQPPRALPEMLLMMPTIYIRTRPPSVRRRPAGRPACVEEHVANTPPAFGKAPVSAEVQTMYKAIYFALLTFKSNSAGICASRIAGEELESCILLMRSTVIH